MRNCVGLSFEEGNNARKTLPIGFLRVPLRTGEGSRKKKKRKKEKVKFCGRKIKGVYKMYNGDGPFIH